MHEGREGSIEREMEVARPIEGVWKTRRKPGAGEDVEERWGRGTARGKESRRWASPGSRARHRRW